MEILINELSLSICTSIEQFRNDYLHLFISVIREFDADKDFILKKQTFWKYNITHSETIYDLLKQKSDESTRIKSIIANLTKEPYWEESQKHKNIDLYQYNGKKINDSSLAESCERDRVVISFKHCDFCDINLSVIKNSSYINIDNLFCTTHYLEVARKRKQLSENDYWKRKFNSKLITLWVENEYLFAKTKQIEQGQSVYREKSNNHYWYLDSFHKNHYEVFDSKGNHIGESDLNGNLNIYKRDRTKSIQI